MANLNGFNAAEVEPQVERELLPNGKYVAVVVESENKDNSAGTGSYLELVFEIVQGEHEGRRLWDRLNLHNPNSKAVEIARAQLSAICRAVGVLTPQDSQELHDLPLVVTVKCKPRKDTGDLVNVVTGYAPKEEPAASSNTNGSAPPWKK